MLILTGLLGLEKMSPVHAQTMYWEDPVSLTNKDSRFPVTVTNGQDSYLLWEEVDSASKQIYLSIRKYSSLTEYEDHQRFAGPFSYSGDEVPDIFSAAIMADGKLAVAAASEYGQIQVFSSINKGETFEQSSLQGSSIMVAPKINIVIYIINY